MPTVRLPDLGGVDRSIQGALGEAHQALRTYDAYRPLIRNSTELIHRVMTPQIVGRGFEVGAMREGSRPTREAPRVLRDGRLILAEPQRGRATEEGGEAGRTGAQRAPETGGRLLTPEINLFEKIFLAHFEGGLPVTGETLEKGHFRFLPKTEKGWAEFFQRFAAFALLKTAKASDVQALVVRGLIRPDGTLTQEAKALLASSKVVLVSDIQFANGKTDKFARLPVAPDSSEALLQALSKTDPGVPVSPEVLAGILKTAGGEFSYLALSHRIVNPDMARAEPSPATQSYQTPEKMRETAMREGVREITAGIALSAKTEQLVAERLDIDLKSRSESGLDRRAGEAGLPAPQTAGLGGKKKKRSSLWGGGADEGYDASVFVPWYQHILKPRKYTGKPRWWVPFLYALTGGIGLLAAYYALRFWM